MNWTLSRMHAHLIDPRQLQSSISRALRQLPGAVALYAFGSLAQGRGDHYSDVDLTVISTDVGASLAARHAVLSRVAPLELEWKIAPSRDAWAATYLLAGVSPYHKLDLGISATDRDVDGVLLWQQDPEPSASLVGPAAPAPFAPEPESVGHNVVDQLLGVTRYAKARRRGNELLCWRFASALLDTTLAMLYARECGAPVPGRRLTTSEYLALDATLAPAARARILERMQFAPADAMDRSVRLLVDDLLETSADLVGGPPLPAPLVAQLLPFFDVELGRDS